MSQNTSTLKKTLRIWLIPFKFRLQEVKGNTLLLLVYNHFTLIQSTSPEGLGIGK